MAPPADEPAAAAADDDDDELVWWCELSLEPVAVAASSAGVKLTLDLGIDEDLGVVVPTRRATIHSTNQTGIFKVAYRPVERGGGVKG